MSQQPPEHSMRAEDDSDRTPEFKQLRHTLITEVNHWLEVQMRRRDVGEPLGGRPILPADRIRRTDLGPNPTGVARVRSEEFEAGVAVTGDGYHQPIALQSVTVHPRSGHVEIVEVKGTDPLATFMYGDRFSAHRQRERVISFTQRSQGGSYYEFSVGGDGRVSHAHRAPNGIHTTRPVRTYEELRAARAAFRQLTGSLERGSRGIE